jgi:hypothetical protein
MKLILTILVIFVLTVAIVCRVTHDYQKGEYGTYVEEVKHRTSNFKHRYDVMYYFWSDGQIIKSTGFTNVPESQLDSLYSAQK